MKLFLIHKLFDQTEGLEGIKLEFNSWEPLKAYLRNRDEYNRHLYETTNLPHRRHIHYSLGWRVEVLQDFSVLPDTETTPEGIKLDDLFKNKQDLTELVNINKRFVITTAVLGCKVSETFYRSLKHYCEVNDAILLIMIAEDTSNKVKTLDALLKDEYIIMDELPLNKNIFVKNIKTVARMIEPLRGLGRLAYRHGSFVVASPKQFLKTIPKSNNAMPHVHMTTGAITLPTYENKSYFSERMSYISESDHRIGAVVAELQDDNIFHFRQLQADKNGNFPDLGVKYYPSGVVKYPPEALVLGDTHVGSVNRSVWDIWIELYEFVGRPKFVIQHDIMDGVTINHHEDNNLNYKSGLTINLKQEMENVCKHLDEQLQNFKEAELIVVKSNHDEWVDIYIKQAKFVKDPQNYLYGCELAIQMSKGVDPLEHTSNEYFGYRLDKNRVKWLKADSDFYVGGIQCGAHGHRGINGSRGNIKQDELAYGKSIAGHGHSMEIWREAWRVGTSTDLKLGYNQGASTWTNTAGLVYPEGERQLISVICDNGNYTWKI